MPTGKAPAFQFYVKDWLSSPDLRMCSCSTKGIWIDLLCYMWEARDRGEVEGTEPLFIKLTGASPSEFKLFYDEAKLYGFCDIVTGSNGSITITNRRMSREEKAKKSNRMRQQTFRHNKKVTDNSNSKITLPSSTATASAKKKYIKKKFIKPNLEEVKSYCLERNNGIDPQYFIDSNEAKGWLVGQTKTPMKDWKAVIRTWEANDKKNKQHGPKASTFHQKANMDKSNLLKGIRENEQNNNPGNTKAIDQA